MAGGKLSARQKMINLMYLVFIAMMAMNMSKEVLTAFGLMSKKLTESNEAATVRNANFMAGLAQQASEQPEKYGKLKSAADQIDILASGLNSYVENLKTKMNATVEHKDKDNPNYEAMDNSSFLDEYFFTGDKLNKNGEDFVNEITKFREGVSGILKSNPELASMAADVEKKFSTEPVTNNEGKKINWLDYHYKGYPLVASLTNLTQIQADVKGTESEVLSAMLQGQLKIEASLTNFEAIVVPDKTAFFNGENFTGKIILGKKDNTLRADKVVVNGRELSEESMQAGQTILNFPAGAVGEQPIKGQFIFKEGGEDVVIDFESSYSVVPKPNSATISADKMNVVYRGVDNPMTISFAGVSDNLVTASAPGLSKGAGTGKYVMRPGGGKEVVINVNGKLPDGAPVSDRATFRIKDIPKPTGTIAGQQDNVSLPRNNVEIATIGAVLNDFDFELPIQVTSFKVKVPGQPSVSVTGNKMNDQAKAQLRKASRGDGIQIFDIKAKIVNNDAVKLPNVSPVFVEITN